MLEAAIDRMGGLDGFVKWAKSTQARQDKFWEFAMRLLPIQIANSGSGTLIVQVTREELERRFEEEGLPPIVFGRDTPKLIEGRALRGNGKGN